MEQLNRRIYGERFKVEVFPFTPKIFTAIHDIGLTTIRMFVSFFLSDTEENGSKSYANSTRYILEHIFLRTIPFHKILEFIRIQDFQKGYPNLGIPKAPFSDRWIRETLAFLTSNYCLVKVDFSKSLSVTPMYGINWPSFFEFVSTEWGNAIKARHDEKNPDVDDESYGLGDTIDVRVTQRILEPLIEYLEDFKKSFAFLAKNEEPITSSENLIIKLKKLKESNVDVEGILDDLRSSKKVIFLKKD